MNDITRMDGISAVPGGHVEPLECKTPAWKKEKLERNYHKDKIRDLEAQNTILQRKLAGARTAIDHMLEVELKPCDGVSIMGNIGVEALKMIDKD